MPFPSALSGTNQTKYRGGTRSVLRYAIPHYPSVMLQLNPSSNSTEATGQIPYSATLSGAITNVEPGMTVLITPTTDYVDDLQNQPENCHRGYVRKDPTASILYIDFTGFAYTTAMYVTVVDNFEVYEKKTRINSGTILKNVDVLYREPLPRIYDFYHDVQVISGASTSYSPTPSFEAMDSGASISSYDWTTIINGTVTQAASTSATPSFTLALGTHWLHLTVTDSNGNANYMVAFVAIVPDDFSSVVTELVAADISADLSNGYSADITAYSDANSQLTTLLPGAFGILFSHVTFTDDTTLDNVEMCGWFDAPVTVGIEGDSDVGLRKTYSTGIIGIKEACKHIRLQQLPVKYAAVPSAWGQFTRVSPYDSLWYLLSEHSTIATVASIDLPASYTDFTYNLRIDTPEGTITDSMDALAFRASGGMANYAPNGEIVFEQSALYATSGRDSLTTYATYDSSERDAVRYGITRPPVNKFALSSVKAGFATYNTTTKRRRIYRAIAPLNETPAALFEELDGIIMSSDLSDTNARIEAGKLTANHFFASSESIATEVTFVGGYMTIIPSCFQWHKFTVAATELLDGSSLSSSMRFLCTSVSVRHDVISGAVEVTAQFRYETDGGDNYIREVEYIPTETEFVKPVYPIGTFSPFLSDYDIQSASDTYGDDFDEDRQGWKDPTLPPEPAAENKVPDPGVLEMLYVPLRGGAISTSFNTTLSDTYIVRVTNDGFVGGDNWCQEWSGSQFSSDYSVTSTGSGSFVAGGVEDTFYNPPGPAARTGVDIYTDFGAEFPVTSVDLTGDIEFISGTGLSFTYAILRDTNGSQNWEVLTRWTPGETPNQNGTNTLSWSGTTTAYGIRIKIDAGLGDQTPNDTIITSAQIAGTGTSPVFASGASCAVADNIRGDAFFYNYQDGSTGTAYSGQGGLNLDGAGIVHGQPYSESHAYEFTITGTGNPFVFSYVDTVDSDLTNNENVNLAVQVIDPDA